MTRPRAPQGLYKLRAWWGNPGGYRALSVPRLEALKRCRNQVTAVRDVVVRADFRHATLGGVSVGAMAGRGIADSDKFMVPWQGLQEIALQAPSVGAGVLEK